MTSHDPVLETLASVLGQALEKLAFSLLDRKIEREGLRVGKECFRFFLHRVRFRHGTSNRAELDHRLSGEVEKPPVKRPWETRGTRRGNSLGAKTAMAESKAFGLEHLHDERCVAGFKPLDPPEEAPAESRLRQTLAGVPRIGQHHQYSPDRLPGKLEASLGPRKPWFGASATLPFLGR
jgi:hypothetical protein